ncbi:MAG: RNA polymerase sigma factor [Thermoanaerobaculia bacterium]
MAAQLSGSRSPQIDAFRDVFVEFFPRLRSFFRSRGFSRDDAEDLSQKTLWNVYQAWDRFRGEGSLESWIYATGRNVASDEWRRQGRRRETRPPAEEIQDRSADPETATSSRQESERVVDALAGLPVRMRACLLLRVQHDLAYREIARRLGISAATVKVQIWMARKRLKEALRT